MDARAQTMATVLASQRLEQLRGLTWGFDEHAPAARASDTTTDLSGRGATSAGRGLSPSPPDALWVKTPGYVDYLDRVGQWVGSGPSPPPQATSIRRWAIEPLSPSPDDLLVLQVLVIPTGAAGSVPQRSARDSIWSREGACLVTVRSRMAR